MKGFGVFLLLLGLFTTLGQAQDSRPDLYNCEGCEAIYEQGFETLSWHTTIPDASEPGDRLVVQGHVYQPGGETPAPGVVLYVYHTNAEGVYPKRGDETGWARRHGYLRGWVKTDAAGRYQFNTICPESYPERKIPAHIHIVVKEPDRREYWIDSIHFEGDALLTPKERASLQDRGGSGIITLAQDPDGVWHGTRDIVLER